MKPSALKRGHPTLNLKKKILLLWVIFALLDPDPLTRLNPDPIRIRILIRNPGPAGGAPPLAGDEAGAAAGPPAQEGDHGQASGQSNRVPDSSCSFDLKYSVADPDPDPPYPHVFGPPGSGFIKQIPV